MEHTLDIVLAFGLQRIFNFCRPEKNPEFFTAVFRPKLYDLITNNY